MVQVGVGVDEGVWVDVRVGVEVDDKEAVPLAGEGLAACTDVWRWMDKLGARFGDDAHWC